MIQAELWSADLTTQLLDTTDLGALLTAEWHDPLNDTGDGTLVLLATDTANATFDYGLIVKLVVGGTTRFSFVVEQREEVRIAQGEEAAQTITYRGQGLLGLLGQALVFPFGADVPTGYNARKPTADDRLFGVMSDEYDHTGWANAVEIADQGTGTAAWQLPDAGGNAPANWPDPTAFWIWGGSSSATDQPEGFVYFRAIFSIPADGQYALFAAGDDFYTVYLDGVPLVGVESDPLQWQVTKRAIVTMENTFHLLAVVAENAPGPTNNPAGFLLTLMEQDAYGALGAVVANTNDTWLALDYPATPPGVTAGVILRQLVEEAGLRDALGGLGLITFGFDDTDDSAANPWPVLPMVSLPVGSTVLDAVRSLADAGHIDVWMDPDTLELHAWVGGTRGTASGVALTPEVNITELRYTGIG